MNIYAKEGHKVVFTGCSVNQQRYRGFADHKLLNQGNTYVVEKTDVKCDYTKVFLKEFPELPFNSVCFDDV